MPTLAVQVACRAAALILAITIASTPIQAGGLYFPEAAVTTMGTAGAGTEAIADDATTLASNPAGMTRLEGKALSLGAGRAMACAEFDVDSTMIGGGDGGDQGSLAPILSAFHVHPLDGPASCRSHWLKWSQASSPVRQCDLADVPIPSR